MLETERYKLPGERLMQEISVAMVTDAVAAILSERA
jgi:hypothetical protein